MNYKIATQALERRLIALGLMTKVGLELEFYLTDLSLQQNSQEHNVQDTISNASRPKTLIITEDMQKKIDYFYLLYDQDNELRNSPKIKKERGNSQYEIAFAPAINNVSQILDDFYQTQAKIISFAQLADLNILFDAKPFAEDYGSALQVNASIYAQNVNYPKLNFDYPKDHNLNNIDNSRHNLFYKGVNIVDNYLLRACIDSMLDLLPGAIYAFIEHEPETAMKRFVPGYMAPYNISWGINNRSTAIRIPDTHPEQRRIEFRIPPANCPPEIAIAFTLASIYAYFYGIYNNEQKIMQTNIIERIYHIQQNSPPPQWKHLPIYGVASDPIYNLMPLPLDTQQAIQIFNFHDILKMLLQ